MSTATHSSHETAVLHVGGLHYAGEKAVELIKEHGRWIEPPALHREPNFRGYVVFLLSKRGN